jgi:hypothetical protein
VVQGGVKNRQPYFLSGQTPVVQPASLTALSAPLTALAASAFISQEAFVASAFALHAAHVPPAAVQAGQADFTAQALDASAAAASAGVLDMEYAETVSAAIDRTIANFFMKPPFVEVNLLYSFHSVKPFCTFHDFLKKVRK